MNKNDQTQILLSTQTIDALDQNEELTDLGFHLADLPVEPHLGKMVLAAVVLKCLDPILTISCSLAYRDPFVLPSQSSQKRAALSSRKHFTSNSFSDHMAFLRAFQVGGVAKAGTRNLDVKTAVITTNMRMRCSACMFLT